MAANAKVKRLVFLTWLLVAVFYFYLSYDYVRISMRDKEFVEYLEYLVQIAGAEQRAAGEVRKLILVKAEQLSVPVEGERLKVLGGGNTLNVTVNYDVDIEVPLLQHEVYSKTFQHEIKYRN